MNNYIYTKDFVGPLSDTDLFIGPPSPLVISSEKQAIQLLELALNDQLTLKNQILVFDGWPKIEVSYEGEYFNSTITSDIAEAITKTQQAVNKAFALLVLDRKSSKNLTQKERENLRLYVKVENGCSLINIDLGKATEILGRDLVGKMNGRHILIGLAIVALTWGGTSIAKHYISAKSAEKNSADILSMSQEETKRLEIVTRALTQRPELKPVQEDYKEVVDSFTAAGTVATNMTFNDVELSQQQTKYLHTTEPARSSPIQLNGTYHIYSANFKNEDSISVSLRNVATGQEFNASFTDHSLNQNQINILQKASFSRQTVYLSINAKKLRDEIQKAEIISVTLNPIITLPPAPKPTTLLLPPPKPTTP